MVIERNEVPRKDPLQLSLFELMEGRYEVICTNQRLKAENIWHLYNRGAVIEQIIDELKNDLCATGIRTDSFWANVVRHARGLWIKIGRDYPLRFCLWEIIEECS